MSVKRLAGLLAAVLLAITLVGCGGHHVSSTAAVIDCNNAAGYAAVDPYGNHLEGTALQQWLTDCVAQGGPLAGR